MSDKIREALLKLDPTSETHWTTEGLPRLDVMKDLVGEPISRANITGAAKSFNRTNPTLEKDTQDGEQTPHDAGAPPATQPASPVETDEANDTMRETLAFIYEGGSTTLKGEPTDEEVEEVLFVARENFARAQEFLREANAAMDVVIYRKEDESAGRTTAHDIKAYQKSQQEQRAGGARRAKAMVDAVKAVQNQK